MFWSNNLTFTSKFLIHVLRFLWHFFKSFSSLRPHRSILGHFFFGVNKIGILETKLIDLFKCGNYRHVSFLVAFLFKIDSFAELVVDPYYGLKQQSQDFNRKFLQSFKGCIQRAGERVRVGKEHFFRNRQGSWSEVIFVRKSIQNRFQWLAVFDYLDMLFG